ncbi:Fpg/Nei family DNA glycosylase [Aerosakkonema funiforme]|uniref:Fpg/Nei family DNA glycosylase n=1 Tax=Aerosakkonema funiforme TaxID=1246630 RepID=UPI0035B6DE7E
MPEGPEVRRFADALDRTLGGKPIVSLKARTKTALSWQKEHPTGVLLNKRIERVLSHGKHLVGLIEGGYYFHSHLMMWGSWAILDNPPQEIDRRERSRIVVPDACAILYSAPIFDLGTGNPFEIVENLRTLGTDILRYPDEKPFDAPEFLQKLLTPENSDRTIGAVLLDQQIVAGIGNYLRAEILFDCRLDPWRKVADLTGEELEHLIHSIPLMAQRAYATGGFTVSDEARTRLQNNPSLVYTPGSEYGTRHYVFRRTNLPCLECGRTIRQLRQVTQADEEGEKTRIIYFCPTCQGTNVELKKSKSKRKVVAANENIIEV